MKINLLNIKDAPKVEKTTHIDMWYNPHLRLWEITPKDDNDYQTDDTEYAYGKKDALWTKKEMERKYNL